MNTKLFLVICFLAAIAGVAVGVYSYGKGSVYTADTSVPQSVIPTKPIGDIQPEFTPGEIVDQSLLAAPVIPSVSSKVTSVTDDTIIITGKDGEMNLPKKSPLLSVFFQKGSEMVAARFDEVKVGMSADVNVIIPGEKVNLILL